MTAKTKTCDKTFARASAACKQCMRDNEQQFLACVNSSSKSNGGKRSKLTMRAQELIERAQYTRAQIVAMLSVEFESAKLSTINTLLSDAKNVKYSKLRDDKNNVIVAKQNDKQIMYIAK